MPEAVIVSTARTPIGKAYRGAFNNTHGATLAGHVIEHAVQRARLDPAEVEDVVIGCAMPEGATGHNIARQAALRAGLPVTVGAMTVNRFCSSGLQAIAIAAQRVVMDGVPVAVAGGVESISLVQNEHQNKFRLTEDWLLEHKPEVYMSMLETAEVVARRYGVTREMQDRYALESQRRIAAAQREGRLDAEIVPLKTVKVVTDKATGQTHEESVTLAQDEGNRADTTAEGLAGLKPVVSAEGTITAGNASQLSDGASACVVMDAKLAERRGIEPLGVFRGLAVAGCEPDEMGIGPVFAVPRLLTRHGLQGGGHRSLGAQRGVRGPGRLLPGPPGNPDGQAERRRRLDRDRPSLRDERGAHDGPRADRGQAARRPARGRDHVRRRRHGRGRPVRDRVVLLRRARAILRQMGPPLPGNRRRDDP